MTDKLFKLVKDTKSSHRSRKRSYADEKEKEKEKDSKKLKVENNTTVITDDPISASSDKIKEIMVNAQLQIKERKKALNAIQQDDVPPVQPIFRTRDNMPNEPSMYNHGLLTKTDSEKARKLAALQAQIANRFNSGLLKNAGAILPTSAAAATAAAPAPPVPPADKPTPLILDESGRTVDITGKEVQLTQVVPTLKANIRAKKREEFRAQLQESKGPEEIEDTHFFDNRIGVKSAVRGKRALKFHEPGKFQQLAERIRVKAQLEKLQNEISQIARKTGISSATKLALIAPKNDGLNDDVPNVEWWDSVILVNNYQTNENGEIQIKLPTITNLVEHPTQMRPPTDPLKPVYMQMFLTSQERKKLRRQNRREAWKEDQEKIRLGLEAPPEPKLRISNLMRVLGTEAIQDPTKIEAHVRQQMAKRLKIHEDANAARRLTVEQKRDKKARKIKEDTTLGVNVSVYR